ncbi:hypothetical protein GCM10010954_10920 [Halobacillus andaensis]|uniref:Uncharacterized protein n=1 Tax=Halobacillus andaensis TaxID=1176239 RepID=A0A917EVY5_HALAA|nr:hypothetical protein [Halobacillus andaensis]MBP2003884.1 hypothetical protein [Halobacillus andaensis]GGF13990.1 hypothetical protein GCM10010954_10920 [Halobacillus andaensis]
MDRAWLHEQVLSVKGQICSGELRFKSQDDYFLQQLDKVRECEDGLVDMNTVSPTLMTLIHAINKS